MNYYILSAVSIITLIYFVYDTLSDKIDAVKRDLEYEKECLGFEKEYSVKLRNDIRFCDAKIDDLAKELGYERVNIIEKAKWEKK